MIEDQVAPKRCGHTEGKSVVGRDEALTRIRAAVDARDAGATSCHGAHRRARVVGLDEAIAAREAVPRARRRPHLPRGAADEAEMRRYARR